MRSRFILLLLACLFFAADQAGAQGSTGLALSVNPTSVNEAAGDATVSVTATLNGGAFTGSTEVTVAVGATGEQATEGTDYATVADFTLTIAAGARTGTATFTLRPTNDNFGEGPETLSVSGTPTGSAAGLTVVNTQITIIDDDAVSSGMTLSVSPPSVAENAGATSVTVTATLAFDALQDATDVAVSLAGGTAMAVSDYAAVADFTVTIPAGSTSANATFMLTPADNSDLAGEKTITISGTADLPLTDRFTTREVTTSTFMTISDDENVVTMSAHPAESTEGSGRVTLRIRATLNAPRATVTTVNTTMFHPHISQINIPIGQLSRDSTAITINNPGNDYYTGDRTWRTTTVFAEPERAPGLTFVETMWVLLEDDTESTGVTLSVSPTSVAENAVGADRTVTVTATLNEAAFPPDDSTDVTVSLGETGDSATEGTDYTAVADFTVTIDGGSTSGSETFTLEPMDDGLAEGDEELSVSGSTTAATMAGTVLTVTGTELTIGDDDAESTGVTLSLSPTTVAENAVGAARTVTVTATLNADSRVGATDVTVSLGETGDTATEGTDYTAVADFTVTIDGGSTSGTETFTLEPTDDGLAEGDEELSVSGSTTAATMAGTQLTVTGTELTITDDDAESTGVTLSLSPTTVAENAVGAARTVTVTATLNADSRVGATDVTVSLGETGDTATEGTDYTAVADFTVTIDGGSTSGTETFTLEPTDDGLAEGDEELSVSGSTTAATMAGTVLTVTGTELTITDDDAESTGVTLSLSPTTVAENAVGAARTVTVTATLNADSRVGATDVTVSLGETGDTATEGTDYTAVADFTVTIDGGSTSGTETFTLEPTDDGLAEGDEELSVSGSTTAATMAGTVLTVTGTELTIGDDDAESTGVTLSLSPTTVAENAVGAARTVTVTATLNADSRVGATDVTVSLGETGDTATEGTDYTAVADFTVTIDGGSTSGTETFTLEPTDDGLAEGDEELSVSGSTTAATMAGTVLTVTGTELTIGDDDAESTGVTLSLSPTTVAENAVGAARTVTVTATLNADSRVGATDVTVSLGETGDTATEGTDYTAVADFTVTIDGGSTSGTETFTLEPTDDGLAEGDEELSVSGSTTAATMAGTVLTVTGTELTIGDDDAESTGVTLSLSPTTVAENAVGAARTVTVTATLNADSRVGATDVTVSLGETGDTATEGTDYTAVADFTVTIDGGSTSGTETFTLEPTDDGLAEGDEELSVSGSTTAATMAGTQLTVTGTELTITDDDTESTEVTLSVSPDHGSWRTRWGRQRQ